MVNGWLSEPMDILQPWWTHHSVGPSRGQLSDWLDVTYLGQTLPNLPGGPF